MINFDKVNNLNKGIEKVLANFKKICIVYLLS